MQYHYDIQAYTLRFRQSAGTSRGYYTERKVWFVYVWDPSDPTHVGMGECAPLPRLSCDDLPNYAEILEAHCQHVARHGSIDSEAIQAYPSMRFGLETALRHYRQQSFALWDHAFSRGEQSIPINGLIWMGNAGEMRQRIQEKLEAGFRCLKLKIGNLDFSTELELLAALRTHFDASQLQLRVDANGAFSPKDAAKKLDQLAAFDLHSIEQPVAAHQWEVLADLCSQSPIPIALDEELIHNGSSVQKVELLDGVKPQYIVLKPSLHGGMQGCDEWIQLAEARHIGWWITSALESNVGLNAIAQWTATKAIHRHQGLGTGALYHNNIQLPLHVKGDQLWYQQRD